MPNHEILHMNFGTSDTKLIYQAKSLLRPVKELFQHFNLSGGRSQQNI